jgi:hypothetical protein
MLSKKLYLVLGENKDLGNRLHSYYVYKAGKNKQIKAKLMIDSLIKNYSDTKLLELAYDNKTRKYINEIILLKKEKNWGKIMLKLLKGIGDLLDREIKSAKKIRQPQKIRQILKKQMQNLAIYNPSDIINIKEEKTGVIQINYVCLRYSPKYDKNKLSYENKFEPWRDTQFIFTLNFNKNLFIWDYINVNKAFHGRKIGTRIAKHIEKLAKSLGFTRFSVEYPNRRYWINKMRYKIPYKFRIGSGRWQYTNEGYKEIR